MTEKAEIHQPSTKPYGSDLNLAKINDLIKAIEAALDTEDLNEDAYVRTLLTGIGANPAIVDDPGLARSFLIGRKRGLEEAKSRRMKAAEGIPEKDPESGRAKAEWARDLTREQAKELLAHCRRVQHFGLFSAFADEKWREPTTALFLRLGYGGSLVDGKRRVPEMDGYLIGCVSYLEEFLGMPEEESLEPVRSPFIPILNALATIASHISTRNPQLARSVRYEITKARELL